MTLKRAKFRSLDGEVVNRTDLDKMIIAIILENTSMTIRQVAYALRMEYKDIRMCMLTMVENIELEKIRRGDTLYYKKANYSALAELFYPADKVEEHFNIKSRFKRPAYKDNISYPNNHIQHGFRGDVVMYNLNK